MVFNSKRKYKEPKVFGIGLGKTGTTTLELALKELGYSMGEQRRGENLIENWAARDFKTIGDFCLTAQAFQDVPFCLPYTFVYLHQTFENAKFILSVRDDAGQWYDSLVRFHAKMFGNKDEKPPTAEQLKNATYIYKGRPYRTNRLIYNTPENDLYNKSYMIDYYNNHISTVREYFRHIPDKCIEINVGIAEDYKRLCGFLEKKPLRETFPWENKT